MAKWTGVGMASARAAIWTRGIGPADDADGSAKPTQPATGAAAEPHGEPDEREPEPAAEPDEHEHGPDAEPDEPDGRWQDVAEPDGRAGQVMAQNQILTPPPVPNYF
eukprot:16120674-Heterocapsa_arctica.AAC.1